MIEDALAFKAATNITFGSATVPDTPPVEALKMPRTLLALFNKKL
jgi:hypothetical protein